MEKKENEGLFQLLVFLKLQNDAILQLLLDSEKGYKKNAYKTIYREIVKAWEKEINESKNSR